MGIFTRFTTLAPRASPRAAMALAALSGDEQCIIFSQLCNVLDPGVAVAFSCASNELRALTQAQRQQLRADHEVATALCHTLEMQSCKELREAKVVDAMNKGLSSAHLALLGTLGSVLPALEDLYLFERSAGPHGVQRLLAGLGAGALPAAIDLAVIGANVGDAGASAVAAALGRGAMPRLQSLHLSRTTLGDAGLVALAPALRWLPALERLVFRGNPFGNEGLAALVAPPLPPVGAPPTPTRAVWRRGLAGGLAKLKALEISSTQVTDTGCAALASALSSGALPELVTIGIGNIPASAASKAAVTAAANHVRQLRDTPDSSETSRSGKAAITYP